MISNRQRRETKKTLIWLAESLDTHRKMMERIIDSGPTLFGPIRWRRYEPFPVSHVDIFEGDAIEKNRAVEYWEGVKAEAVNIDDPKIRRHNIRVADKKIKEELAINRMMAL